MTDFEELKAAGAIAVSDDGRPVSTAGQMEEAMIRAARLGLKVLSHCEELSLTRGGIMNAGEVSRRLGVPGLCRGAEEIATAREIALAASSGCPVHICHVSTRKRRPAAGCAPPGRSGDRGDCPSLFFTDGFPAGKAGCRLSYESSAENPPRCACRDRRLVRRNLVRYRHGSRPAYVGGQGGFLRAPNGRWVWRLPWPPVSRIW